MIDCGPTCDFGGEQRAERHARPAGIAADRPGHGRRRLAAGHLQPADHARVARGTPASACTRTW